MKMNLKNQPLLTFFAIVCGLIGSSTCWAQAATAESAQDTMTAEQVLARYVEVTGGIEKYKAIKGMLQEATMSMADMGLEGTMSIAFSGPDKVLVEVDFGGLTSEKTGVSGDIGWAQSSMTGDRLISDKELEQLRIQGGMQQYTEPSEVYKSMELTGQEEVNGENCYVLKLTFKSGDVAYEYYSVKSGLKLKSKQTVDSPMGALEIESYFSDYQEIDGMKHAMKSTQALPNNMEMEAKITKIEINPTFSADKFELPAEIKKLVE